MTNVLEFKKKKKLPIPREAIVIKRIDGEDVELVNVDALTSKQRQLYFDGQYGVREKDELVVDSDRMDCLRRNGIRNFKSFIR